MGICVCMNMAYFYVYYWMFEYVIQLVSSIYNINWHGIYYVLEYKCP